MFYLIYYLKYKCLILLIIICFCCFGDQFWLFHVKQCMFFIKYRFFCVCRFKILFIICFRYVLSKAQKVNYQFSRFLQLIFTIISTINQCFTWNKQLCFFIVLRFIVHYLCKKTKSTKVLPDFIDIFIKSK